MEVEVYADLLFLINAGMDGLCFFLTAMLLHRRLSPWRLLLGSALGGIYAVVALFLDVGRAGSLLLDAGMCLLLCAVVLYRRKAGGAGAYLLATAVYAVLSMTLGGIMTALYTLFNRIGLAELLPEGEEGPGVWLFAILALAGGAITLWGGRFFRRSASLRLCRVTVEVDGQSAELEGTVDTGNLLRDPLSGRMVICGERRLLEPLLSPALLAALRSGGSMAALTGKDARRLRLIPAATVTGGGMLVGFLPDRLTLTYASKGQTKVREVRAILTLSELTDTQALIPGELIDG